MMKSYTLSNWDGSRGGSDDNSAKQTLTTTQTSAHPLPSNLTSPASNYAANSETTISDTLLESETTKGGSGNDTQYPDASIQARSTVRGDITEKIYRIEESYNSFEEHLRTNKPENRTAPWRTESGGSYENASKGTESDLVTEHIGFSRAQFVAQRIAAEPTGREANIPVQPDLSSKRDVHRNPDSVKTLLDSDILSISATVHLSHAQDSNNTNDSTSTLMFKPDLSSPLHILGATRTSPIPAKPSQVNRLDVRLESPLSSIYLPSQIPSPQSHKSNLDDAISVHTADGEGSDHDDDVIILHSVSCDSSPQKYIYRENGDSLFTPPPSEYNVAVEELFTPPPLNKKRKAPCLRTLMSHILIPPLKRPRTDYHSVLRPAIMKQRPVQSAKQVKKAQRPVPRPPAENDLARAMQGSFEHNDSLGILPQKPQKNGNANLLKVKAAKQREIRPMTADPSFQSASTSQNVHRQKRPRDDVEFVEEAIILSKKPRITPIDTHIDLTISDADDNRKQVPENKAKTQKVQTQQPKLTAKTAAKPAAKSTVERSLHAARIPVARIPFARTQYSAGKDILRLHIGHIKQTPPDLVFYNTRFIRRRAQASTPQDSNPHSADDWPTFRKRSRSKRIHWPLPSRSSSHTTDVDDEMTLGGELAWEDDFYSDDGGDSDDERVGSSVKDRVATPIVRPSATPAPHKIDLGVQLKKRIQQKKTPAKESRPAVIASVPTPASSIRVTNPQKAKGKPSSKATKNDVPTVPVTPSEKALGKRKAPNPEVLVTPSYHSPASQTTNAPIDELQPSFNYESNAFTHDYPLSPLRPPSNSISQNTSGLYSPPQQDLTSHSQLYNDLISTSSTTNPYPFASQHIPPSPHNGCLYFDGFDNLREHQFNSWQGGTIDPTLLGGHFFEPGYEESDVYQDPNNYQVPYSDDAVLNLETHNPFPGPLASYEDEGNVDEDAVAFILSQSNAGLHRPPSLASSESSTTFKLPPRSARRATSLRSLSSSSSDDNDMESDVPLAGIQKAIPMNAAEPEKWPMTEVSISCHQCHVKTQILKMYCPCGKRYCYKCLVLRYPNIKFFDPGNQPPCPSCDKYCNCSACRDKWNPDPETPSSDPETDSSIHFKRPKRSYNFKKKAFVLPDAPVLPENAQYWGTIYSLDGQRIGSTFAAPTENGLPSVVFPSSQGWVGPLRNPKRTFVGKRQRCWGFGRDAIYKELNPIPPMRSKSRKSGYRRTRSFVGSPIFLRYRAKPSTLGGQDDYFLGGLSPLTMLSESEDQEENEKPTLEEAFTPGCLEERDVARAIAASFLSLGISPVFQPPSLR